MRGVTFTDAANASSSRHTGNDWSLVMTSKTIGAPAVKVKSVEIPDRDGVLDYTSALRGVPSYETRTLTFTFEYLDALSLWPTKINDIRNFLHGQRIRIDDPDDTSYYYMGRASVSDVTGGLVKAFTVDVTADTWKYKATGATVVTKPVAASTTVTLVNDWKPVVPSITTTAAVTFTFGGDTYTISGAGSFKFPRMVLTKGNNVVTLSSGSGTITFTYQEGAL